MRKMKMMTTNHTCMHAHKIRSGHNFTTVYAESDTRISCSFSWPTVW
jgi:hypothetical protein